MKGVLFVAAICSLVGVGNATCDGATCAQYCNGAFCAQNCTGLRCGDACIGNSCAENCNGFMCGRNCIGKNCALNCTSSACDQDCFHFENEICSANNNGITMGKPCSFQFLFYPLCELKNHPAVWQALKDTGNSINEITIPTIAVEQCYYDTGLNSCERTKNKLPPLVCKEPRDLCYDGEIPDYQKCTDTEKCGVCQGICEEDSECKGDLKCFSRTGTETVPGCSSSSSGENMDVPGKGYCADTSTTDSSTLNDGEIAAIVIGVFVLSAAVGALAWWCKKTKRGFFGSSSSMAETIKF